MGEAGATWSRLQEELLQEKAAALARIAERLESLLSELRAARACPRPRGETQREAQTRAYRALRRQAQRYRWYLEVQREALGLRRHEGLDEFYPLPPPSLDLDLEEAAGKTQP